MSAALGRRPAITIGLPVFNGAADLAGSLDCLRGQTFTDFDVIIFDNASTDGTAEIAAACVAMEPRFRYVGAPRPAVDLDEIISRRGQFMAIGRQFIDERSAPGLKRTIATAALWRYTSRGGFDAFKLARRRLRRALGLRL